MRDEIVDRRTGSAPMPRAGDIPRDSKRLGEIIAVLVRYGLVEPFRARASITPSEGMKLH